MNITCLSCDFRSTVSTWENSARANSRILIHWLMDPKRGGATGGLLIAIWMCRKVPSFTQNLVHTSQPHPLLALRDQATFLQGWILHLHLEPTLLPTQSVQIMSSQRNLGIPQQDMEPLGQSVNLLKGTVPVPVQDVSRLISSGNSSGGLSSASPCFPSGPSGSSIVNISNGVVFNTSKPLSLGISGSSFANISNDSPPLATSMPFLSSRSCSSYASILRGKILGASKGIPFEDISDGEMLAPSIHLPLQSPELVNQPSVQIQSSSADLFNQVAREAHQFAGPCNSSNSCKALCRQGFLILVTTFECLKVHHRGTSPRSTSCQDLQPPLDIFEHLEMCIRTKLQGSQGKQHHW